MSTMYIIITLLLLSVSLCISFRSHRIAKAIKHRQFFIDDAAGCCESLSFVGCSVICHSVKDIEQIENLLGVEYDRYEVVAVIDSRLFPDIFYSIVERYALIRVNAASNNEIPDVRIRTLYRSRQRCFRRLVLVDAAFTSACNALNCATAVASFDYIIPIGPTMRLRQYAIESVALLISENLNSDFDAIHCSADSDCYIFRREAIIRSGGFSANITRQIPRRRVISSALPIVYSTSTAHNRWWGMWLILGITTLAIGCTLLFAKWILAVAIILTALLITLITRYTAMHIDSQNCSERTMLCCFGNLMRIFYHRKFIV